MQDVRRLRVDRLSDIGWQLAYAACFHDAVSERGLLAGAGRRERLFLLSAAYNAGFWLDREALIARARVPRYGPDPLRAGRCRYYKVVACFAEHELRRIMGERRRRS